MPAESLVDVGPLTLAVTVWCAREPTDRAPVLLLPATGETAADWDGVADTLALSRTVYAVSLRGHGRSDWPGVYSIRLMAADVVALLDRWRLPPNVDVVGHSLGGLVACSVALARPERVRRLVLEDVGLLLPRRAALPARPAGALSFDWAVVEQVRPEIDDFDPGWAQVVAAITAPTLVISGGPSSPIAQDRIDALVALLADGQSRTVDAGHLIHAAEPAQFTDHVLRFLDEGASRPG